MRPTYNGILNGLECNIYGDMRLNDIPRNVNRGIDGQTGILKYQRGKQRVHF